MNVDFILNTDGRGIWSNCVQSVQCFKLHLAYVDEDTNDFGELQVLFDTKTWDTTEHGLIYTDRLFLFGLRANLLELGFSEEAVKEVSYSEQGMQGDDYVSLDVGGKFINEFKRLSA